MNRPDREPTIITRGEIAGTIIILAIVVLFLNFSLWQLRRLEERRTMNAAIAARLTAAPIRAATILADTAGALYRRVQLEGTYDNTRSIVLPGRGHQGTPGVHLVTPLVLASSGMAVLVNRGWVPSPDAATIELDSFPAVAPDPVTGLALPFLDRRASVSTRTDTTADAGVFRRVWYNVDEPALRAQFPYTLAPFLVQLTPDAGVRGFPRRLPPPALDEGSHLGYAIQWFAFAMIGVIGWITFLVRRRAERSGAPVVRAPPHPPER